MGTALALGRPGPAAVAMAGVAICLFLAHEPLLVLLGQRGARAARVDRQRARRRIAILGAVAVALAWPAVSLSAVAARLSLVAPVALGGALLIVIVAGREHTIGGETLSALALASVSLPVALAAGATQAIALTCAAVYGVSFVSATLAVHAVVMCTRRPPAAARRLTTVGVAAGSLVGLIWFASRGTLAASAPYAALPPFVVSCALSARPPSATHLRSVGWTLAASSVMTWAVLLATIR